MNVAKWLVLSVVLLPLAELAAFIVVAASIGFILALGLALMTTLVGAILLRHAGGNHIARVRNVWDQGSFSALQADSTGILVLLAGFFLLIPGFITDVVGILLLLARWWRALGAALGRGEPPIYGDRVVDLPPEQWHRVPDPVLPDRKQDERKNWPA